MTEPKFEPTHAVTYQGQSIVVMVVDGAAYTHAEWESCTTADWEVHDSGVWTFQGDVPPGPYSVTVLRDTPVENAYRAAVAAYREILPAFEAADDGSNDSLAVEWAIAVRDPNIGRQYLEVGCWAAACVRELIDAGVTPDHLTDRAIWRAVAKAKRFDNSLAYAHSNGDVSTATIIAAVFGQGSVNG